jgi:hypothetical protein
MGLCMGLSMGLAVSTFQESIVFAGDLQLLWPVQTCGAWHVLYSHQQNDQQVTSVKTFFNQLQAADHSRLVPYNPEQQQVTIGQAFSLDLHQQAARKKSANSCGREVECWSLAGARALAKTLPWRFICCTCK